MKTQSQKSHTSIKLTLYLYSIRMIFFLLLSPVLFLVAGEGTAGASGTAQEVLRKTFFYSPSGYTHVGCYSLMVAG